MAELLLELCSEEIPSRMQPRAADHLKDIVAAKLSEAGIAYSDISGFFTPRRIGIVVNGLDIEQPDVEIEKKGPRIDAPRQAIEGFVNSVGLTMDQLEKRTTDKGQYYFAVSKQEGQQTAQLLKPVLESAIPSLNWEKSMRWGSYSMRWVRPLKHITCVFDTKIVPLEIGHLVANDQVSGHPFFDAEPFKVKSFMAYRESLREHHVILDPEERKNFIWSEAEKKAAEFGLELKADPKLLDEVTGLVEWPVVLVGEFDPAFLDVPSEALISAMRSHQKYFPLYTQDGKLSSHFIFVSNSPATEAHEAIIEGNQRVLHARLSDAKFFWDVDCKSSLSANAEKLGDIIFHAKLGTVADKTSRIASLAKFLAIWVPHASLPLVARAAELCKADLTTEMVSEFPELQGIMGGYYAVHDSEDKEVAEAVREHYHPQGPGDYCPKAPVSNAIALADKIDTLVGLFAVGEKPTGSKDPFALRRAAIGVIRIILENNYRIPLKLLLEKSISLYPKSVLKKQGQSKIVPMIGELLKADKDDKDSKNDKDGKKQSKASSKDVVDELLSFFAERLKSLLKSNEIRYDLINAVFDVGLDGGLEDDLLRLVARVRGLEAFLQTEDGRRLHAAYKRATNIVLIEEKKDKTSYRDTPQKDLLVQEEEQQLFACLGQAKNNVAKALKEDNFTQAMTEVVSLTQPVDAFFDQVIVNCDAKDVRVNRLRLLSQMRALLDQVANFSCIEG